MSNNYFLVSSNGGEVQVEYDTKLHTYGAPVGIQI